MDNEKIEFDCWSHNNENYYSDFESARDYLDIGDTIYEAVQVVPDVSNFVDVDWTIERMSEHAYENHGECAEGYLDDVSTEAKKELEDLIIAWLNKNGKPSFYSVANVHQRPITIDDY